MKKNIFQKGGLVFAGLASIVLLAACSDNNDEPANEGGDGGGTISPSAYVVPVTVDEANYLLTATSLEEGTITAKNNGLESVGAAYWIYQNDELFGLVYNKGAAGTGASYYLNANGALEKNLEYTMKRFSTYGLWTNEIVTVSTGNSTEADSEGNLAQAFLVNHLNTKDGSKTEETIVSENLLGNGEKVTLSGIVNANGKLYTSVIPMGMSKYGLNKWPEKALENGKYIDKNANSSSKGTIPATQYPDRAYVAIYPNGLTGTPNIISTDKIGYATGRYRSQYLQTIWAADNGDVYVFSPGLGRQALSTDTLQKVTGKLPSGVVRIKAGATDFDPSYYVNLETIGTKHPIHRSWHATGDYFLLQLFKDGVEGLMQGSMKGDVSELAIFKGEDGTIKAVTGLPDDATINGEPYGENGKLYLAITVKNGDYPAIYAIDPATGVATKGLVVEAEGIKTVGKLNYKAN